MRTGDWMLSPEGAPCRGSLGVLADGYAVVAERPDGHWAVSTEISVSFCSALPIDGTTLYAESYAVEFDLVGGLSKGRIFDRLGRTIALGTERVRFVPETPSSPAYRVGAGGFVGPVGLTESHHLSTADLLGATTRQSDSGATVELTAGLDLSNPMGSLHGGISLCASEIAGLAALQSSSHPLVTTSVHIAYLRPVSYSATALHRGRNLGVAQVVSHNSAGQACSVATVTCHQPR